MPVRVPIKGVAALVLLAAALAACGRGRALGELRYFPGATVVGTDSFVREAFGFPRAAWDQVELRTAAPYERVRDFYAGMAVKGTTSSFSSETTKSAGRVYTRFMADHGRRHFYAVTVEERQASRDVGVLLRRGIAR